MAKEDIMELSMEYCDSDDDLKNKNEKDKRRTEINIGRGNVFDDEEYDGGNGGFGSNGGFGGGRPVECATQ